MLTFVAPNHATVEILDLETMTWSVGPAMPEPCTWSTSVVYNDNLLVIGGDCGDLEDSK